jgi:hypothetical protein
MILEQPQQLTLHSASLGHTQRIFAEGDGVRIHGIGKGLQDSSLPSKIRPAMKRPAQRIPSELPTAIDFGAEELWLRSVQIGLPDLSARRNALT